MAWLFLRLTRDALHPTPLAKATPHRHRARPTAAASEPNFYSSEPRAARPVRASPRGKPTDRPRSTRSAARTWRGCLRGQRATRTIPHRSPRLFGTDTEPGRRLWLRSIVTLEPKYRVARPARASTRAEPANRPRSTRALADLAWLSSRQLSDALHPTLLAMAPLHRYCARPTAAGSKPCDHGFRAPCRTARARFAPWKTGRSPTEHTKRSADLAWLSSWPTSDAHHPTPFAAALRHRHRARPTAVASEHRDPRA